MRHGLTEETVQKLHDYESSDLPERTKAALRLADTLVGDDRTIDAAFHKQLRAHFTDAELLDLGMSLGFALGWQRFIEAFGIRPDNWTDGMPLPWVPHAGATAEGDS